MSNRRRVTWLIGAWLAATAAAAGVAVAVVGLVGEQIADQAVRPLSAEQVEALGVTAPTVLTSAATTLPTDATPAPGTDLTPPVATTTTVGPALVEPTIIPSSASGTAPTTTSMPATTTSSTSTSSTTSTTEAPQLDSRRITGGTVVVRWEASGVVELVSASPEDGFTVDVEKRGPEQVRVEFEGGGVQSRYAAEVSGGRLVVEIQVESDDD